MYRKRKHPSVQKGLRDIISEFLTGFQSWLWAMGVEGMEIDSDYACGYSYACGCGCQRRNKGGEGEEQGALSLTRAI